MSESDMPAKLAAEFLGTFLLVFTVGCNVLSHTHWAGVSIASVLMVSIYALGGISGANFNPAVSVALGIAKSMKGPGLDWKTVGIYCLVQVLGGLVGAFSYAIMFWEAFNLSPTKGFGGLSAGLCETLYTFMLCFVVLNVAAAKKYSESKEHNEWYGLAIGFVIIAGAYGAGAVSGGCFNPAVAIGVDSSSAGLGFGWCVVYTFFELIGAGLAAVAFKVVRPGDFDPMRAKDLRAELTSEFLGTFMLVLTVGLNVLAESPAAAFSIAASLMCMIYALGDVSGAHFNPAVTLAIRASGLGHPELSNKKTGLYMLVQVAGGIVAAFMYAFIYDGKTFALGPKGDHTWTQVGVAEIIFTFVLCFTVLCVAVHPKTKSLDMFGLAIGSCVTVGGFAIGSISGGCLNPAVSIGIALSALLDGGMFYKALIYSIFELLGAVLAAAVLVGTHSNKGKESLLP